MATAALPNPGARQYVLVYWSLFIEGDDVLRVH